MYYSCPLRQTMCCGVWQPYISFDATPQLFPPTTEVLKYKVLYLPWAPYHRRDIYKHRWSLRSQAITNFSSALHHSNDCKTAATVLLLRNVPQQRQRPACAIVQQ